MSRSRAARRPAAAGALLALVLAGAACDDRPVRTSSASVEHVDDARSTPVDTFLPSTAAERYTTAFRAAGGHMASARDRALVVLDAAGSDANGDALRALSTGSSAVRRGAARHLARHGDADSVPALIEALESGTGGDGLRSELIAALGHIATDDCVAALALLVEGPSDREAFQAGRELAASSADLPREQLRALAGMGNDAHMRAASLLALGTTVVAEEAALFRAGAMDFAPPIRSCAAEGLARLPDVTRDEMSALIDDEDGGVRLSALRALRHCSAEWTATVAAKALRDKYDEHRVAACEVITARPDAHSYEVLLAVLTNGKEEAHVRGAAARGLLSIDPARGVGAVEVVAAEDSGGARLYCRDALAQVTDDER